MIFAANLKCNHTRESFQAYAESLNEVSLSKNEIFVFPPSTAFLKEKINFTQGAQNFYPCLNGAFTGEIGQEHLNEFNINCVLIAHSERRALESEALIKAKFEFAKEKGFIIFFCIGEDLETKNKGNSKEFLKNQLKLIDLNYEKLIIAYEPIYSIGTGVSADEKDISEILEFLSTFTKARLLYGGSVNESNIKRILSIKHCSGVLVGSFALKAQNFIKLIKG